MKRVLCIWLPNWPVQRLVVARPELSGRAIILHARDPRRGERVVYCSQIALELGIRPGMSLAEADGKEAAGSRRTAAEASTSLLPHSPDTDRAALEQLAEWCHQFSPTVGLEVADEPSCLLLDIAGSAPRLGGERMLAENIARAFQQRGYGVRVAVADTIGAAWAMAKAGREAEGRRGREESGSEQKQQSINSKETCVLSSESHASQPASSLPSSFISIGSHSSPSAFYLLPSAFLRLPDDTITLLHQLGIHTIGQLMQLPRNALRARFGDQLLLRLDQMCGVVDEAIVAHRPAPSFQAQWTLEHPTARRDAIEQIVMQLIEQLSSQLFAQGAGAVQMDCCFDCPPAPATWLPIRLYRPTADVSHLGELFRLQLEQQRLPGPVQHISLCATTTAPLINHQNGLFAELSPHTPHQLAQLINRLGCRLGSDGIVGAQLLADPQIEHSYRYVALTGKRPKLPKSRSTTIRHHQRTPGMRPLFLYGSPIPLKATSVVPYGPPVSFNHNGQLHRVTHHWGPERIETSWWRGPTIRRDYYRVEDDCGSRFWVFRDLRKGKWFLQGEM